MLLQEVIRKLLVMEVENKLLGAWGKCSMRLKYESLEDSALWFYGLCVKRGPLGSGENAMGGEAKAICWRYQPTGKKMKPLC